MSDPRHTQTDTEPPDSLSSVEIVMLAAVIIAIAIPLMMIFAAL